jgi:peptidoglycan/xylan/chitin deacetylase (PgdA/CDA1 family)
MAKDFPIPSFDESDANILPVLMFHAPKRDVLDQQFQWIKQNNFVPIHLNEVSEYFLDPLSTHFPYKKIVFTFDDGYQNFLVSVCPLLKAFEFKATLCIPTGDIPYQESDREPPPKWTDGKGSLMTWDEIKRLRFIKTTDGEDLLEFIPHSVTHRYYDELEKLNNPENEFRREAKNSKETLCKILGLDSSYIKFYCLPGGIGEGKETVERILEEEGYTGALRAQYKEGDKWNRYRIPRCEPHCIEDLARLLSDGQFHCD